MVESKKGIIAELWKFFKSNVFLAGLIAFTWYVWDKEAWGVIPFIGFILAYFLLFGKIYRLVDTIPQRYYHFIKKSLLPVLPGIVGLCLSDWLGWYVWGNLLLAVSGILIIWLLPRYLELTFSSKDLVNKRSTRKYLCLVLAALLTASLIHPLYLQYRYEHTVSKLESSSDSVRRGALYSLGNFAEKHDDYSRAAVQVLSSIARGSSPWNKKKDGQPDPHAVRIVQVLGEIQKDKQALGTKVDLRRIDLRGADLQEMNLDEAVFMDANLSKADLFRSSLNGINAKRAAFHNAKMRFSRARSADFFLVKAHKADCRQVRFQEARLTYGSWEGSDFRSSRLQKAVIRGNSLRNVKLARARMQEANGRRARFHNSDLRRALLDKGNFQEARFIKARLTKASLTEADISHAEFSKADLRNADLRNCIARHASFRNADLRGADFEGADLEFADMTGAKIDKTIFKNADLKGVKGLEKEVGKR